MSPKRLKTSFVESIIDTLAKDITCLSLNPTRHCVLYARPSIRIHDTDEIWIAYGIFSKNIAGMPSDLTVVRLPAREDEHQDWEPHRPMFLTHDEAGRYADTQFGTWVHPCDFAFVFSSSDDEFPLMAYYEEILPFERIEIVTGRFMIDQADVSIVGQENADMHILQNVAAFQEQVAPTIARMLGRFYPEDNNLGIYTDFNYQ